MSHYYHSPPRDFPKLYIPPDSNTPHYNTRPNTNRADHKYPIYQNHNIYTPSHGNIQIDEKRIDQPPLRYAVLEGRNGVDYPNAYRPSPTNHPGNSVNYGSQNRQEVSPFTRLVRFQDSPQGLYEAQKGYIERDGSWNSKELYKEILGANHIQIELIRRPEENRIQKSQKLENWKKELDVQIREQKIKKRQEEEDIKNQKIRDELRYQKQIEEMNLKSLELRQLREQMDLQKQSKAGKAHKAKDKRDYDGFTGKMRRKGSLGNKRDFSIDSDDGRPRQRINAFIDNLKAEIIHGQKVFMKDIRDAQSVNKKQDRFRNLAERNMLGAQNGGVIRGGLHLKEKDDFTVGDDAFTQSVEVNRQRNLHQFDSPRLPNLPGPVDQDKDDADDFFTQLTNFGKANDKAKAKALAKANQLPSNKTTEADFYNQPEINFEYAKPPTENIQKKASPKPEIKTIKKEFSSPQGLKKQPMEMKAVQSQKEFQIVKETQIKVNEQVIKKETSTVEIKPLEKIPASTKSSSSALLNQPQSQAKLLPELSKQKPEEEKKQSAVEKKPQTPVKSQAKDVQKPEDRVLIEIYDDEQPERPSIELNADNRPVQAENNTKKDAEIPTQNEIGSPVAMQDFMKQTARDKNGMVTDRTEAPSLPAINNLPKREETPLDQRKIKNFNLFKDSRRGSVETVNLDIFEDMLAKEVKRGNAPTFKSPRENTEVAFEGFGYGTKRKDLIKGKKSHKSVAIKSTVTAKAIMQAMDKEGLEMNFYSKKVDPIAKLDYMIDHLFG